MRNGSKMKAIAETLIDDGLITNIQVLEGYPVRTNRLAAVISALREQYGFRIDSDVKYGSTGKYLDCIYTLIEAPERT